MKRKVTCFSYRNLEPIITFLKKIGTLIIKLKHKCEFMSYHLKKIDRFDILFLAFFLWTDISNHACLKEMRQPYSAIIDSR